MKGLGQRRVTVALPGLLIVAVIMSLYAHDASAWHDFNKPVMMPSNPEWNCKNYGGIDVRNNVDFCAEVKKATATWNGVSDSDFELRYTTAAITNIHVKGSSMDIMRPAESVQALSNGKLVGADIKWNAFNYCFTDSSKLGADRSCFDIQSVAAHEFGHMQWVGHSVLNTDSIMQDNISPNTERHNVEQHDIDVLRARH